MGTGGRLIREGGFIAGGGFIGVFIVIRQFSISFVRFKIRMYRRITLLS